MQTFLCKCALHPDGHWVPKKNKVIHLLEVQQLLGRQTTPITLGTEEAYVNPRPTMSIDTDSIGSFMTGLNLTDKGPVITEQHSRLWSSSDEVPRSSNIPTSMKTIPISDIQNGVNAILKETLPSLVPSSRSPDPSRHNPPQPATFAHPIPKVKASVRKATNIIRAVEAEARAAAATLDFEPECRPTDDTLRTLLDAAVMSVDSGGKSLSRVRNQSKAVVDLKNKVLLNLRSLDSRITQLGALLLPPSTERNPVMVETNHVYENPVAKLDTIAQVMILLGAVCHIIVGLSSEPCDFIINAVTMLVKMAMATRLTNPTDTHPKSQYSPSQCAILDQLPTSLFTALNRFDIDGLTSTYATCPSCNFTHISVYDPVSTTAIYPAQCVNIIVGADGRHTCGANLLEQRNGCQRPIKPFVTASFADYLARSLADPEVERLSKQACDDAMNSITSPSDESTNIFNANFMKTFNGPTAGELFVNRGNKIRLAFAMHIDFFHPNGTRKRGNHDSIGIISLANLNLPETIRYLPEHIFLLGVIPGPKEPALEELNFFIRPLIDQLEIGWKRGFHISRTADAPECGEDVEVALVLSVNDLPAARKVVSLAGHGAHFYCSVCDCYNTDTMYNTNIELWATRNVQQLRRQAEAWRDADTLKERDKILVEYGVRWSELWRLPYWDPTRMLVIDSMHCILEGLVHYHCRRVLRIDARVARAVDPHQPVYSYPWTCYDESICQGGAPLKPKEIKHVGEIQRLLTLPINSGDGSLNDSKLLKRLGGKNRDSLKFVAHSLSLNEILLENGIRVPAKTKQHFATLLVQWRLQMPWSNPEDVGKVCTLDTLQYIQHVIKTTIRPSWVHSVPSNYGEHSAGTIKADEWRILSTIYLPFAFITLWGEKDGLPVPEGSRFLRLLDHTMALFQAVTLVLRYTMNTSRAAQYRTFIKEWVDGLYPLYPHTTKHKKRPNVHAAFHLYDFLLLFGPVISWWCFPFERLIGALQKINTNNIIGGPLEQTMLRSHMRAANLRRWLRRSDCPEIIRQFKSLFDKAFLSAEEKPIRTQPRHSNAPHEVANYNYNGFNFSRASTHLGNSLVLYYPTPSSVMPVAGSIEKITVTSNTTILSIRRQAPLAPGQFDPFRRYPSFPASAYSANMVEGPPDKVSFDSVVSQVARFSFLFNRVVVLNLSRI